MADPANVSSHPLADLPRRIVTDVLRMPAVEVRNPVTVGILMEADDDPGDRRSGRWIRTHAWSVSGTKEQSRDP